MRIRTGLGILLIPSWNRQFILVKNILLGIFNLGNARSKLYTTSQEASESLQCQLVKGIQSTYGHHVQ